MNTKSPKPQCDCINKILDYMIERESPDSEPNKLPKPLASFPDMNLLTGSLSNQIEIRCAGKKTKKHPIIHSYCAFCGKEYKTIDNEVVELTKIEQLGKILPFVTEPEDLGMIQHIIRELTEIETKLINDISPKNEIT